MINKMKKPAAVFLLLVMFILTSNSFAQRYIRDIETDPAEIEPGDSFTVIVDLRETTWGKTIKFYINNREFDSKNAAGDVDSIESVKWDMDDRPLECGEHELKIEIVRAGNSIEEEIMELTIGNVPEMTLNPVQPNPSKQITVRFTDRKTGEPIKNGDIEINRLHDIEGTRIKGDTNALGEMTFNTGKIGEYKLEMTSKEYCITENFWIKKTMLVDGPHPATPIIDGLISFAVPPGVGVKIADEEGNIVKTASTSISGGVNFTIEEAGNYTVIIGELSTEFWEQNISLEVLDKLTPIVETTPVNAVVNRPVNIKISVAGELIDPISGIEVRVKKPTGEQSTYITDMNGIVTFTPLFVGEYLIRVERDDLRTVTKSMKALNMLNAGIVSDDIMVNDEIEVIVKDQGSVLVDKASISVEGTGISGLTNMNGKFKFSLSKPGDYTLTVTKNDSWGDEEEFSVLGYLFMDLDSDEIELGEDVEISVYDIDDEGVDALLEAVKPDKTTERITGTTYRPSEVGGYSITASKSMYNEVTKSLFVNPHDIDITTNISDNELLIRVSSKGEPVRDLSVLLETTEGTDKRETDRRGIVEYDITKEEIVTINANLVDNIKEYGTRTLSVKVYKNYDYTLLSGVVLLILLLAAAAIVLINLVHGKTDEPRKKRRKGSLDRDKGRTRLSKV